MEIIKNFQGNSAEIISLKKETFIELWLFAVFVFFLVLIRDSFHVLFHTLAELYTCLVSFGLFFIALNINKLNKNNFIVFLGIGYFFISVIDMFHIFTYSGVSLIFPNGDQSIVVQFWISARYLMAFTLLGSTLLLYRHEKYFRTYRVFFSYFMVCLITLLLILYFRVFPACYIFGQGLTQFKIISEYIIIFILLLVGILYFNLRNNMDFYFFLYMEGYLILTVISEMLFTSFFSPYDWTNVWSHLIRVISYMFLYKAIIETSLKRPYTVLFHKIDSIDNELNIASNKLQQELQQKMIMEEMLAKNDRCYELIINNSSDAIVVTSEGKFIFANEKAAEIFGVDKPGDLIGMEMFSFIQPEERVNVEYNIEQLKSESKTPICYECKIAATSGNVTYVEVMSDYLLYHGKLSDISILKDISPKKQINRLRNNIRDNMQALNETKEYNKMLTEFFSNISHELKTPLNVILGAIQILALPNDSVIPEYIENKLNKNHRIIKQNCYRLLRLVNNIIDLSKFDSGYFKLKLSNQNIVNIVEEITLSVVDYIENRGLEIIFDTDVEEKVIAVDTDKIERIILNLLSNSIKFTDKGGKIFVTMTDMNDRVAISIKDTGIGIPEDKLNTIFDRFNQIDKTLARNKEGSGIGLSLVKTIVEMHDGTIRISSVEGKGTEIIIELPVGTIVNKDTIKNSAAVPLSVEKINIEFSDIYSVE